MFSNLSAYLATEATFKLWHDRLGFYGKRGYKQYSHVIMYTYELSVLIVVSVINAFTETKVKTRNSYLSISACGNPLLCAPQP